MISKRIIKHRPVAISYNRLEQLQIRLIHWSFCNLFLVACVGVLLRTFPFFNSFPLEYKNVLHSHSHFAFGGWVMPVILALVMQYFPELTRAIAYKHWRNVAALLLISAYGMLLSFPVQGYKTVSIFFSTLSVIASYYMAIIIWKAIKKFCNNTSYQFLKWGLLYMVLSSLGPFATAPLIILGYQGSPIYFNAIYFYLHFQYNGWFTFAILALFCRAFEDKSIRSNFFTAFKLFNFSVVPAYFLSVLWMKPAIIYNVVGGSAAVLQLFGALYFLSSLSFRVLQSKLSKWILNISVVAFSLKLLLQLTSAFQPVADMAYSYRNFIIFYLHLVLLGFVSFSVIAFVVIKLNNRISNLFKPGFLLFVVAFICTETLLVLNALGAIYGWEIQAYKTQMLLFSILLALASLVIFFSIHVDVRLNTTKETLNKINNVLAQSSSVRTSL